MLLVVAEWKSLVLFHSVSTFNLLCKASKLKEKGSGTLTFRKVKELKKSWKRQRSRISQFHRQQSEGNLIHCGLDSLVAERELFGKLLLIGDLLCFFILAVNVTEMYLDKVKHLFFLINSVLFPSVHESKKARRAVWFMSGTTTSIQIAY